jgi:hypothetical protein
MFRHLRYQLQHKFHIYEIMYKIFEIHQIFYKHIPVFFYHNPDHLFYKKFS